MDYQISRELLPPMDNLTMQQHISAVCMQKNHIWGWNGGQVVDWFPHWGVTERWWQTGTTSSPALRPPTSFMMDMLWGCVWHCVPLYHAQQGGITHQNHTKLNFHRGSDVALLPLSCSVDSTASERMSEKCPFCLFFSKGGFISFKSSLLL